uniref:Uncharacterized protein n=1 Tax=Arundo donax TaxID=35708 RepID=A0A0A9G484_ARUDO
MRTSSEPEPEPAPWVMTSFWSSPARVGSVVPGRRRRRSARVRRWSGTMWKRTSET